MAFLTPEQLQRIADELAVELPSIVWADETGPSEVRVEGGDRAAEEQVRVFRDPHQEVAGESEACLAKARK